MDSIADIESKPLERVEGAANAPFLPSLRTEVLTIAYADRAFFGKPHPSLFADWFSQSSGWRWFWRFLVHACIGWKGNTV